ncbi:hypothetical protein GLAREA_09578 [Glarea lozoyensis ATCC 20868]|uniref:Uncharacterized protein n=1 Tax=Glarea lozoyensis (strain ATCC 20868 / MF5171) TaxID=1116229 RepID=S3CPQ2_GLAL2|nr:uncharacterized protein GLAREA_09578 [Glarea lozoyensis ATCC 20868]EPE28457.1 hypothetical protein GLAREA_09578 [Glarea lozoyensis ATCC 20868]
MLARDMVVPHVPSIEEINFRQHLLITRQDALKKAFEALVNPSDQIESIPYHLLTPEEEMDHQKAIEVSNLKVDVLRQQTDLAQNQYDEAVAAREMHLERRREANRRLYLEKAVKLQTEILDAEIESIRREAEIEKTLARLEGRDVVEDDQEEPSREMMSQWLLRVGGGDPLSRRATGRDQRRTLRSDYEDGKERR